VTYFPLDQVTNNLMRRRELIAFLSGAAATGQATSPLISPLEPTKFDFILDLKTAKALGLEIPLKLHAFADEVIE
jgi:hypothetical protein